MVSARSVSRCHSSKPRGYLKVSKQKSKLTARRIAGIEPNSEASRLDDDGDRAVYRERGDQVVAQNHHNQDEALRQLDRQDSTILRMNEIISATEKRYRRM